MIENTCDGGKFWTTMEQIPIMMNINGTNGNAAIAIALPMPLSDKARMAAIQRSTTEYNLAQHNECSTTNVAQRM